MKTAFKCKFIVSTPTKMLSIEKKLPTKNIKLGEIGNKLRKKISGQNLL